MDYEFDDLDYPEDFLETYDYTEDDYNGNFGQYYSLRELWNDCLSPTLIDGFNGTFTVLMCSLLLRFTCSLGILPPVLVHMTSYGCGVYCLCHYFGRDSIFIFCLALLGYATIWTVWKVVGRLSGPICVLVCFAYFILCELFIKDGASWHKIRGSQMILAMKLISVAFDIDNGVQSLPPIEQFFGYLFCVGTVIFGPWVSFHSYSKILHHRGKNFQWACRIIYSILVAYLFLTVSTCWTSWFFHNSSWRWVGAYRDALSFRSSHYFVSYLSEALAVTAGISSSSTSWSLPVAHPDKIEVPRSLVEVVTNWNLPFHFWLKTYVFNVAKPLGNFAAVLLTYAASSLLHGLNFQLSAVLLSLGIYTYVEHGLRKKLASIFNACILAKKCQNCAHMHRQDNPYVVVVNLTFGLLSMFHLAYLGVMFDSSSPSEEKGYNMQHTLRKWSDLDFASHWVAFGTYLFYILIT